MINRFLNEFEQPTELTNETLKPSSKAFKRALKAGGDETLAETVTKIYYLTYSFSPQRQNFNEILSSEVIEQQKLTINFSTRGNKGDKKKFQSRF